MITNSNGDGVGSNLVANLSGSVDHRLKKGCYPSSKERVAPIRMIYLDHWSMSNSTNRGKHWSSVGQSTIQEDLWVSLSLLPLGNHGIPSRSWSKKHGDSGIGESVRVRPVAVVSCGISVGARFGEVPNNWHSSSVGIGQSTIQVDLWVSLSGGEGEQSGSLE